MIIQKYFNKEVLQTAIAILLLLVTVAILNQFTTILNKVAEGTVTMQIIWPVLMMSIPNLLSLLLPLATLLSLVLVISRWYADNEMVILQTAGYSYIKLLCLILKPTWWLVLGAVVINFWLAPLTTKIRDTLLEQQGQAQKAAWLVPRHFHVANNGKYVIYVDGKADNNEVVTGVFLAAQPNFAVHTAKWNIILSNSAHEQNDILTLVDGYHYELDPMRLDWRIIKFHDYNMQILLQDVKNKMHNHAKSTLALWLSNSTADQAELHWRLALSLAPLLLAVVALPLSHVAPRHGRFTKILPAILLFCIYYQMLITITHWLERGTLPIYYGAWPVHISMLVLAYMLYSWQRWKLR